MILEAGKNTAYDEIHNSHSTSQIVHLMGLEGFKTSQCNTLIKISIKVKAHNIAYELSLISVQDSFTCK